MNYPFKVSTLSFFGDVIKGQWGGVPWSMATKVLMNELQGATSIWSWGDNLKTTAVMFQSKADINTDGSGGSKSEDPDWRPDTALVWPDGSYVNSHEYPGVVVPPQFIRQLGVRKGDVALVAWGQTICPAVVYDVGPMLKIGEVSIHLAQQLGLPNITARSGHSSKDVVTLIFSNSGNRRARTLSEVELLIKHYWDLFTGR